MKIGRASRYILKRRSDQIEDDRELMEHLITIDHALQRLMDSGGSDIVISAGSPQRMRKDGKLLPLDSQSRVMTPIDTERIVREVLNAHQWEDLARNRQVDFAFTWRENARIRGNAYYQRGSLAVAFRLLPLAIPTFEQLGIPEAVHKLLGRKQGLILVTGPTGSGKSTSQAAMIDHLNQTRPYHIITIEDPIEYVHRHKMSIVDQREVGVDTRTFAEGLRAAFREDPDVVLIGEMRDLETISAALTVAETGHLVLATLHTNDAPQAVDRVVDSFSGAQQQQIRVQLAACLAGVIYQQLVPAHGGGRVAAFEILMANVAVRSMIKERKTDQLRSVIQTGVRDGSQTLERSLSQLIRAGVVSDRDAKAHSLNPDEIRPI
jgi:twitching motility protein PilT